MPFFIGSISTPVASHFRWWSAATEGGRRPTEVAADHQRKWPDDVRSFLILNLSCCPVNSSALHLRLTCRVTLTFCLERLAKLTIVLLVASEILPARLSVAPQN
jgi:hypothetical protein